ncbi:MAG: RecX family transcriptional regulator [Pacificimonas sp.]
MRVVGVQSSARLWQHHGVATEKSFRNRDFDAPRKRKTLDAAGLRALALRYVERYATTHTKLLRYLGRKIRERDWTDEAPPDPEALANRFVELGYVDDRIYGEAKARSLASRGYGKRRVDGALREAGISDGLRDEIAAQHKSRAALLVFAKRKRLGPFATDAPDRDKERKQFAACLRAGHDMDDVRRLFAATDATDLEAEWSAADDGI